MGNAKYYERSILEADTLLNNISYKISLLCSSHSRKWCGRTVNVKAGKLTLTVKYLY